MGISYFNGKQNIVFSDQTLRGVELLDAYVQLILIEIPSINEWRLDDLKSPLDIDIRVYNN